MPQQYLLLAIADSGSGTLGHIGGPRVDRLYRSPGYSAPPEQLSQAPSRWAGPISQGGAEALSVSDIVSIT
jgi:hypothetical protein